MDDHTKQVLSETVEKTVEAAEEAVRLPFFKRLARIGFFAKGLLFIVIGTLAILVSLGSNEGKISDAVGALAAIAERPFGKVLLIAFVVGAIGHGIWNILRGAADVDDAGNGWQGIVKRVISIGIGIFYLGLAVAAANIIFAARVSPDNSHAEETFIYVLLAVPFFGAVLLFLIGLGIIGAGFHECYSGLSGKYQESYRLWEITGFHMTFITILGVLSFTARAVILVLMGYFFATAAFVGLEGSVGMDAALLALVQTYYGRTLLFVTAIGLIAHGILAMYEAKYRRIC
jgi:uncharacterized protein DUF1206